MSFKILGLGDPHLNSPDDFDNNSMESWLEQLDDEDMYDLLFVVGDVVDNVPNDRKFGGTREKDLETGRSFYSELDELGERFGFESLGIPGNHDWDIHPDIISGFENVHNAQNSVYGSEELGGEPGYILISRGAPQFDLRPEIDYRNYSFYRNADNHMEKKNSLKLLENALMMSGEHGQNLDSVEEAEDRLDIEEERREDFRREAMDYFEEHEEVRELFETAYDEYGEESQVLFADHIAPFNTEVDFKNVAGEHVDHWGSISDKNAINLYEPDVTINGHHHHGQYDFIPGYDTGTNVINIGEKRAVEIAFDGGVTYNILN